MQSAFRANSREVLGGESTGRGREVHRDDWVLGVANEERRQARPKDLVNVDIVHRCMVSSGCQLQMGLLVNSETRHREELQPNLLESQELKR